MWGQWFIEGNVVRDLAALNKVEMLPWDGWGIMGAEKSASPGDDFYAEVSALSVSGDFQAIRRRYESDAALRVPRRITSWQRSGPTEVDVPEIV
jgi:hypothetical protein